MKFTLRHWLIGCVPLGLVFGLLQRPLRDPDFLRGFLGAWYWLLWLCYAEGCIPPEASEYVRDRYATGPLIVPISRGVNHVELAGSMLGGFSQILLLALIVVFGIGGCVSLFERRQAAAAATDDEQEEDEEDQPAEVDDDDNARPLIHPL